MRSVVQSILLNASEKWSVSSHKRSQPDMASPRVETNAFPILTALYKQKPFVFTFTHSIDFIFIMSRSSEEAKTKQKKRINFRSEWKTVLPAYRHWMFACLRRCHLFVRDSAASCPNDFAKCLLLLYVITCFILPVRPTFVSFSPCLWQNAFGSNMPSRLTRLRLNKWKWKWRKRKKVSLLGLSECAFAFSVRFNLLQVYGVACSNDMFTVKNVLDDDSDASLKIQTFFCCVDLLYSATWKKRGQPNEKLKKSAMKSFHWPVIVRRSYTLYCRRCFACLVDEIYPLIHSLNK